MKREKAIAGLVIRIRLMAAMAATLSTGVRLGLRWGREVRLCKAASPPDLKRAAHL